MQPDGRLVEHVEHAAQPAAHLGGQADALHLAAGERGAGPGQRQVIQPHVDEELHAVADLAEHFAGDLALGRPSGFHARNSASSLPSGSRQ